MKKIILITLLAIVIVVAFYVSAVFYEGIELLIMPLLLILGLAAIIGIGAIPIFIFRTFKHESKGNLLTWSSGLAIGTYLGFMISMPLLDWDSENRDLSGQIIVDELERYKATNLEYPNHLTELGTTQLNSKLPETYQLDRFNYRRTTEQFDLDIPASIMDRFHWDIENSKWEYQ